MVALTGYGRPSDKEAALEAGFDAHLVKPLDPEALTRLLAERAMSMQSGDAASSSGTLRAG